jgi:hypothetical protein
VKLALDFFLVLYLRLSCIAFKQKDDFRGRKERCCTSALGKYSVTCGGQCFTGSTQLAN